MNILNDKTDQNHVDLNQIEQVQQEKMEYKLIDTFLRTPGLKLWFYNPEKDLVEEVISQEVKSATAQINFTSPNDFIVEDFEHKSITIDPRNIFFEALHLESAQNRVEKWKTGKVKQLCNLRKPSSEGIKLW